MDENPYKAPQIEISVPLKPQPESRRGWQGKTPPQWMIFLWIACAAALCLATAWILSLYFNPR